MKVFGVWMVFIVAVATSCVSVKPPVAKATEEMTFSAGAAEAQITTTRDREKVHRDMYARALVLSDGSARLAILTLDFTGLGSEQIREIRQGIEKATGIPAAHVTINCSHTHNAPWPNGETEWADGLPYGKWLTKRCIAVAARANEELRPCRLMFDRPPIQIGFNRRLMWNDSHITMAINPHGAVAPWTDIIGAYDREDGARVAVLFTYAAHPVVTQFSDVISSDYPGSAIVKLKEYLTGGGGTEMAGVLMFGQGCGGNVNAFPVRGGPEACDATGGKLAAAVTRAALKEVTPGSLKAESLTLTIPYRAPPTVEEVEQVIEEEPDDERRKKLLRTAQAGDEPRSREYPMRAMAIGPDVCVLSLPQETFVEYQLFAVENSPFKHTIVLGYCNSGAYVATAAAYELGIRGGYEASPYGNALDTQYGLPLDPSVEQIIKDGIVELLDTLALGCKSPE